MKRPSYFSTRLILMFFFAGLINQVEAQGIRNEGATVNIASGCYVVCQGGFNNSSGAVINDGTMTIAGPITNPVSAIIEGDGSYNIGGDLINNGAFTQAAGTTTFNGNVAQTISGSSVTTFNDLVIDDASSGTTIAAGAMVTVSGSTFNTNGKLIINSDAVNNSGSLIYSGSSTPTGNITYNRMMPTGSPGSLYRYISSPVSAPTFPSGTFWRWNEPIGAWGEDIAETPTTACSSGIGYTILAIGNTVIFTGSVVAATVSDPLTITATAPYNSYADHYTDQRTPGGGQWGGGGWNLLGNPFTSALDAEAFIDYNNGTVDGSEEDNSFDPSYQAVYIYNGADYYYIAAGVSGYEGLGTFPTYTDIQAGQGFFVLANYNEVTFNFTSAMQRHNISVPMTKSAKAEEDPWPGLQLKVKYGDKENSTLIVYNENMTASLDPGYDVGQLSANPDIEIYTSLVAKDNSVNFARQALPVDDCCKFIIPVGIDSKKGGEVTFSAFTVPLGDNKFWLEDRKAGTFTDMNNNTYTVTIPANTYGTGRFYIIASVNTPTGIDSETEASGNDLRIWTYDGKVIIKGTVNEGALCEIYDTGGRKVMMIRLKDGELNTVTLPAGSRGVYLVRVIDGVKVVTRKVAFI